MITVFCWFINVWRWKNIIWSITLRSVTKLLATYIISVKLYKFSLGLRNFSLGERYLGMTWTTRSWWLNNGCCNSLYWNSKRFNLGWIRQHSLIPDVAQMLPSLVTVLSRKLGKICRKNISACTNIIQWHLFLTPPWNLVWRHVRGGSRDVDLRGLNDWGLRIKLQNHQVWNYAVHQKFFYQNLTSAWAPLHHTTGSATAKFSLNFAIEKSEKDLCVGSGAFN